ncbi:hypothetical protein SAMN04488097_3301 [Epilithonimonas lactis]|nr:hypothetical protein SAMN04488097_3301 [Epilithonimonas lactis]
MKKDVLSVRIFKKSNCILNNELAILLQILQKETTPEDSLWWKTKKLSLGIVSVHGML